MTLSKAAQAEWKAAQLKKRMEKEARLMEALGEDYIPPVERRSSRIHMQMTMAADSNEDKTRGAKMVTPPPSSNCEKITEAMESHETVRSAISVVTPQPAAKAAGSKRSSRAGSAASAASASRERAICTTQIAAAAGAVAVGAAPAVSNESSSDMKKYIIKMEKEDVAIEVLHNEGIEAPAAIAPKAKKTAKRKLSHGSNEVGSKKEVVAAVDSVSNMKKKAAEIKTEVAWTEEIDAPIELSRKIKKEVETPIEPSKEVKKSAKRKLSDDMTEVAIKKEVIPATEASDCRKEADGLAFARVKEEKAESSQHSMQGRRSTRSQVRIAVEASKNEDETRTTKMVTPPPVFPSNCEKTNEMIESIVKALMKPVKEEMVEQEEEEVVLFPTRREAAGKQSLTPKTASLTQKKSSKKERSPEKVASHVKIASLVPKKEISQKKEESPVKQETPKPKTKKKKVVMEEVAPVLIPVAVATTTKKKAAVAASPAPKTTVGPSAKPRHEDKVSSVKKTPTLKKSHKKQPPKTPSIVFHPVSAAEKQRLQQQIEPLEETAETSLRMVKEECPPSSVIFDEDKEAEEKMKETIPLPLAPPMILVKEEASPDPKTTVTPLTKSLPLPPVPPMILVKEETCPAPKTTVTAPAKSLPLPPVPPMIPVKEEASPAPKTTVTPPAKLPHEDKILSEEEMRALEKAVVAALLAQANTVVPPAKPPTEDKVPSVNKTLTHKKSPVKTGEAKKEEEKEDIAIGDDTVAPAVAAIARAPVGKKQRYRKKAYHEDDDYDGEEAMSETEEASSESDQDDDMAELRKHFYPERRSTRIQMRIAMEASANEEEARNARKAKPTIFYPSNCEKIKEAKESQEILRRAKVLKPTGKGSKRSSRAGSAACASASSSRESIICTQVVPAPRPAPSTVPPATAASSRSVIEILSPPPHRKFTPPSCMEMSKTTTEAMTAQIPRRSSTAAFAATPRPVTTTGHYPRLDFLFGAGGVHQKQQTLVAPRHTLFPAPLSSDLLCTLYNPAWLRRKQVDADEERAIQQRGHAHFMLPARLNRMNTMMEKCLRALEETSMPLPPLQMLLPSPCPLLSNGPCCSAPLTDVLDSLPPIPLQPYLFGTHRVTTAPKPVYTTAFESARYHIPSKNEDKKWFEVRTFPSFDSLRSPAQPITSFSQPTSAYVMADRNKRIHASKCTYVTTKSPIFAVHESWPMPTTQHRPITTRAAVSFTSVYSTPPPTAVTTPTSHRGEQVHGSRPPSVFSPRSYPDPRPTSPPGQPYPPTPTPPPPPPSPSPPVTDCREASSSSPSNSPSYVLPLTPPAPMQKKRPAEHEETPVMVKCMRPSVYEPYEMPEMPAELEEVEVEWVEDVIHGLEEQDAVQEEQDALALSPLEEELYLTTSIEQSPLQMERWINDVEEMAEYDDIIGPSGPKVITIEEDGTTLMSL